MSLQHPVTNDARFPPSRRLAQHEFDQQPATPKPLHDGQHAASISYISPPLPGKKQCSNIPSPVDNTPTPSAVQHAKQALRRKNHATIDPRFLTLGSFDRQQVPPSLTLQQALSTARHKRFQPTPQVSTRDLHPDDARAEIVRLGLLHGSKDVARKIEHRGSSQRDWSVRPNRKSDPSSSDDSCDEEVDWDEFIHSERIEDLAGQGQRSEGRYDMAKDIPDDFFAEAEPVRVPVFEQSVEGEVALRTDGSVGGELGPRHGHDDYPEYVTEAPWAQKQWEAPSMFSSD